MNFKDTATQLAFSVVPVAVRDMGGAEKRCTGVLYSHPLDLEKKTASLFLLVPSWLVRGASTLTAAFWRGTGEAPAFGDRLKVEFQLPSSGDFSDDSLGIAAVPVGGFLQTLREAKDNVFYRSVGADLIPNQERLEALSARENVFAVGFLEDLTGLWTEFPVFREGITGGPLWNQAGQTKEFFICGTSLSAFLGGPVFIHNEGAYAEGSEVKLGGRLLFLGMITPGLKRELADQWDRLGVGRVIRSAGIRDFIQRRIEKALSAVK